MKSTIKIVQQEHKTANSGLQYYRLKDGFSGDWFACFDRELAEAIISNMNVPIEVDIKTSEKGSSITNFFGIGKEQAILPTANKQVVDDKSLTMYVSYAKDLFISMSEKAANNISAKDLMASCVELVKLAKTELSK